MTLGPVGMMGAIVVARPYAVEVSNLLQACLYFCMYMCVCCMGMY